MKKLSNLIAHLETHTSAENKAKVQETIFPHKIIQTYLLSTRSSISQRVTHGSEAGRMWHRTSCVAIIGNVYNDKYQIISAERLNDASLDMDNRSILAIVHNCDIGKITDATCVFDRYNPDKHIVGYDTFGPQHLLYCKDELTKDIDNNYRAKTSVVQLTEYYYDNDTFAYQPMTRFSDRYGSYIHVRDAVQCCITDEWFYSGDSDLEDQGVDFVCANHDDVRWAEDTGRYHHVNDVEYCDDDQVYYTLHYIDERNSSSRIQEYHCGIDPARYIKDNSTDVLNRYTIGFEVEKTDIDGYTSGRVEPQPLFSHWERDSSCGVEGVTNVYSLDNYELFKEHANSSNYLQEDTNSDCGGHINFAHRTQRLEMWHIKPWMGLFFSMYRPRLNNSYSNRNKKIDPYRGREFHYGAVVEKGRPTYKRFEIRLPNRVRTTDVILRRFKIMQAFVRCVNLFVEEDFDAILTREFDDNVTGYPNWINPSDKLENSAQLISKYVPPPTRRRMRYLIEESRDLLLEVYSPGSQRLAELIYQTYLFQTFIDTSLDELETRDFLETSSISSYIR